MARTLEQIIGELDKTYNPQVESVRSRQALIPGQIAEEEKGLQAKQEQAFGDILGGARRRGLGFSGIPLGEQAKYTSTEFLPALARLKQQGKEQAMSLEDAILGIRERRDTLAQNLRESELSREEQIRQFNENMAFQRQQFEESKRQAARATAAAASPTFGPLDSAPSGPQALPTVDEQKVYNQARSLANAIGKKTWAASEAHALVQSAKRGNARDAQVLKLFYQLRGTQPPASLRGILG